MSRLLLSTLLALLVSCGQAQPVPPEIGSVWVVESPTSKLYLCGTIHLLRETDYPLPLGYEIAYKDSAQLIFELPPGSSRDPALAMKMNQAGTLPDGASLADQVPPATWSALEIWGQDRGVSVGMLKRMTPWLAALAITQSEYALLGADPLRGVDYLFETRAKTDQKPGFGLETLDFQINLFTGLNADQQKQLLEQTLDEIKDLPQIYGNMISAWRKADTESLHRMLFEEAEKYPGLMELFLTQRNARWIDRLEQCIANKTNTMVLVGTGHLGGPGGVIQLLEAKGHKVTRLNPVVEPIVSQAKPQR
jgi:uncharacterized protein